MEKRTREIIALVLLVVLGLSAACAMGWYILVGHNWNRAATHIDDLVGSMDGYTVVVYDGVVKDHSSSTQAKTSGKSSSSASTSATAQSAGSSTASAESTTVSASSAAAEPTVSASAAPAASSESSSSASADSAAASSSASSASGKSAEAETPVFDAEAVAENYREKGASVVALGKDCMTEYAEPEILYRNGKRIGVFAFSEKYKLHFAQFRANIRYLQSHSVDFIVAIAKDKAILKGRLDGINLLVLRRDAGIPETGEYKKSTFCADSPYIGEVQAIIVSPSGVITSRTVKEL